MIDVAMLQVKIKFRLKFLNQGCSHFPLCACPNPNS